jgi:tetratricopeptide (TPR) repeat protein
VVILLTQGSALVPSRLRLWSFRLVTFILIPVLLLGILEAGLRLLAPGHSTDFTTKAVVDGVTVFHENDAFAWQYFPAEIAREPLVLSFPAEKASNVYRIFVLGASAAQGDPEPTYGFSRILEQMLEHGYPGADFEVINTAVTAINSHVVYQIAREVAPLQGDLFIIYLGNNEVVGPFGTGTVFAPLSPSLAFIRLVILSRSSRIVQNLACVLRRLRSERGGIEKWRGMEMFLDRQVRADDPGMEKVYRHFRANLEDTLSVIRRAGAKAIVSTVGTNLRDSAPFASQHRRRFAEPEREQWDALYRSGAALAEAGRCEEAGARLLEAEKIDGTWAALQFLLGVCFGEMGDHREARHRYRLARDLDTLRFRADSRINEIIREVAAARAGEGVYLADSAREFEAASAHGIPGDDLFHEHVHLTFKGHYLLAKALLHQVEKILPADVARFREGNGELQTADDLMRALALTGFDRHRISEEVRQRLEKPPFTNQQNHRDALERARRQEAELRAFTTPAALLEAGREYERALQANRADPWLHYNYAMLHYAAGSFAAAAAQFRIVLASLPHHEVARERLLASLVHLGEFEEAVDQSREALRNQPDFHAAEYTLALALSKTGREAEAVAVYRKLLRSDRDRAPDIYNELGQIHVRKERYAEAALAFEEGVRIDRDSGEGSRPDLSYNLGVALKRDGRTEDAARAFSEAVAGYHRKLQRNPRSARLHFALGSVYVEMREFQNAADQFRLAVAANPADLQAHLHLAKSLEVQGRLPEARDALESGVEGMLERGRPESARVLRRQLGALESVRSNAE